MEITKERLHVVIEALRKCAKEHENDVVCTGKVKVSSLCRDVADYLEHLDKEGEE